ncbi:MAG: GNAT family N-acetyltransferase [Betaproteobacteria bacterium RIFCSPHIGHO2_12_FULL_69_13]|nr:MAG: GNAT family N-acetyltransferase [Betaproteobacteria bacterium RIFCSPHIGHO2_12_FULL_69_13]OGA69659.1 MAG: GNAT family N-acetyltransferase [Betaproteobacteria bacterium RIFCSPLOWO2_12_FULL_68_20]
MPRIELLPWNDARAQASRIRFAVFVEEQRVPPEIELDDMDARCIHALAYAPDGTAIGTGRLLPDGHIGRMAVIRDWRGRGVGSAILESLVRAAASRGDSRVVLSAQTHALDFYRRQGFVAEGEVYEEAGIPHQAMRRTL